MRITRLRYVFINSSETQQSIANATGISGSTLSKYALGRTQIRPHHLARLCAYFHLNPESLLGYVDADDIVDWPKPEERITQ